MLPCKDLQIACHKYDIILCSETLVSNRRHISEISLPGFNNPTLLLRDSRPRIRGLATYIRSGFSAAIKKENVCTYHEFHVIRVCSRSNNFWLRWFDLQLSPDFHEWYKRIRQKVILYFCWQTECSLTGGTQIYESHWSSWYCSTWFRKSIQLYTTHQRTNT